MHYLRNIKIKIETKIKHDQVEVDNFEGKDFPGLSRKEIHLLELMLGGEIFPVGVSTLRRLRTLRLSGKQMRS